MTAVLLVRHAPTAWNAEGRLQGRADPPLSAAGRRALAGWRMPDEFAGAPLLTSPLERARATAGAFGAAKVEPRLIEMDWGAWEGRRLAELREANPEGVARIEALGLDLRPPGGERPRDVQERLRALFSDLVHGRHWVLVTHKTVQRAALALATGWDYRAEPPLTLRTGGALRLQLDAAGMPRTEVAAVSLFSAPASCGS